MIMLSKQFGTRESARIAALRLRVVGMVPSASAKGFTVEAVVRFPVNPLTSCRLALAGWTLERQE
jgi:hypothetical protein